MGYISQEIYDYHVAKAWERRKKAKEPSEQEYWNTIIYWLKCDFEGKSLSPH